MQLPPIILGKLVIRRDGYHGFKEDIAPNSLNINQMKEIAFPLIRKPEGVHDMHVVAAAEDNSRCLDLHVIDHEGNVHQSEYQKDPDKDQGASIIKLKNIKEKVGFYRFFASVIDASRVTTQNVKVWLITQDSLKQY